MKRSFAKTIKHARKAVIASLDVNRKARVLIARSKRLIAKSEAQVLVVNAHQSRPKKAA